VNCASMSCASRPVRHHLRLDHEHLDLLDEVSDVGIETIGQRSHVDITVGEQPVLERVEAGEVGVSLGLGIVVSASVDEAVRVGEELRDGLDLLPGDAHLAVQLARGLEVTGADSVRERFRVLGKGLRLSEHERGVLRRGRVELRLVDGEGCSGLAAAFTRDEIGRAHV